MPLNESFKPRSNRLQITKLSAIPSAEDLRFAQTRAKPGTPIAMSWSIGLEKRVLFVIPSADRETSWILRTDEEFDAPLIWRYATQDTEVIHTMLVGEIPQLEAAVIPAELRPGQDVPQVSKAGSGEDHEPEAPSEQDFEPGSIFEERYEIVSFVGSGGMGAVYKARQVSIDRFVALKVLHPDLVQDPVSKKRFEHEAKAASTLMHPNLIVVHDFGFSKKGQPFIVMDYLEGPTLHDLIEAEGPMQPERFVRVFSQCCLALSHAHKRSVVHRDIKPCNIVLSAEDSEPGVVKILDFGIAKVLDKKGMRAQDQHLTHTGNIVGSPFFMSPEQCCGLAVDNRSDLYSLGCVMYAAATACAPFVGDDPLRTMYKHLYEVAPPFASMRPDLSIPYELERIVFKALEKQPEKRYQSADELEADLHRFQVLLARMSGKLTSTADSLPAAQEGVAASEILARAEIITAEDLRAARELQANLGGEVTAILVAQGKLPYAVMDAANRCAALIMEGDLTFEHSVILVGFCNRSQATFEKAAEQLGWDWLKSA